MLWCNKCVCEGVAVVMRDINVKTRVICVIPVLLFFNSLKIMAQWVMFRDCYI